VDIFGNILDHQFIYTTFMFHAPKLPTQFKVDATYGVSLFVFLWVFLENVFYSNATKTL